MHRSPNTQDASALHGTDPSIRESPPLRIFDLPPTTQLHAPAAEPGRRCCPRAVRSAQVRSRGWTDARGWQFLARGVGHYALRACSGVYGDGGRV
ncbi:hypothetical protein M3J09_002186 [Ascochyta lentis]